MEINGGMCVLEVQTVVCEDVIGQRSAPVNVSLIGNIAAMLSSN